MEACPPTAGARHARPEPRCRPIEGGFRRPGRSRGRQRGRRGYRRREAGHPARMGPCLGKAGVHRGAGMSGPASRSGVLRGLATLPLIGGSVTLIGSPTCATAPAAPGTLTTCAAWRPFERRALVLGCFGRQRGDMTRFTNPGSRFHAWSGPDAAGPGLDARSRAAIVPAAVGYPLTDPEAEAQWSGVSPGPDDLRSPLDSSQALARPHPAGGSARLKRDPDVTQGAYRRSEKYKISIPINTLECIRLLDESFPPESGVPRRRMCLDVGRTTGTLR